MSFSSFTRSVLPLLAFLVLPALARAQQTVRCESNDGKRKYCNAPINSPNQVTMQRQISGSPCVRGNTWGVDNRGIWVDKGCRADFNIAYAGGPGPGMPGPAVSSIKCESNNGKRNYCNTGFIDARQVSIQQQISGSPCNRGATWGVDNQGLWVDRGCRAIFNISNWNGSGEGWWNPGPGPAPWPPSGNWQGGNWERGGACFYSERNFGGKYLCLRRGESRGKFGNLGDDISSIRVFGGARVLFYEDDNFKGRASGTKRDVPDLRQFNVAGSSRNWNNRISSARVN
jgi:hypothetical protein